MQDIKLLLLHALVGLLCCCTAAEVDHLDNFLLIVGTNQNKSEISRMSIATMTPEVLPIDNIGTISSVDYEIEQNCVLWTDIDENAILRQCFSPIRDKEILHQTSDGVIGLMTYDWISEMVYFTNLMGPQIEVISTASTPYRAELHRTVVEVEGDSTPYSIAVHPKSGYIFWACGRGSDIGVVMRANLDGSDVRSLYQIGTHPLPIIVIVDFELERLFWMSTNTFIIRSCDFNGAKYEVIVPDIEWTSIAIAMVNNNIFLLDTELRIMQKVRVKEYNGNGIELIGAVDKPHVSMVLENACYTDMRFISRYIQSEGNACSGEHGCSHACVGAPDNEFICVCPPKMQLSQSGICE